MGFLERCTGNGRALLTEMQSNGVLFDLATKVIVECAFEESRIGAVNNIKHDLERLLMLVEKSIDTYGSNDHLDRP